MASFEEDLKFANQILRIRTAAVDGTLFKDVAFKFHDLGGGRFEITFDHNNRISTIGYLENRDDAFQTSYSGYARISYNSQKDTYTVIGSEEDYRFLPTAPDEAWYFQESLIYNDEILRGAIIMKTLAATPMPGFKQFIVMPMLLDKILTRMDQEGI